MKDQTMYWEPELETLSRAELNTLQSERLRTTVARAALSPYYADVFRQHNLRPDDIRTVDDIRRIPPTTKQDLRASYPFGLLAVPKRQCTRLHCSSGTTGDRTEAPQSTPAGTLSIPPSSLLDQLRYRLERRVLCVAHQRKQDRLDRRHRCPARAQEGQ